MKKANDLKLKAKAVVTATVAALSAFGATSASAAEQFSNGFVVPNAYWNSGEFTAVGVVARQQASVYWKFFDQSGENVIASGCMPVYANSFSPFIWGGGKEAPSVTSGLRGYLVFAALRQPDSEKLCNESKNERTAQVFSGASDHHLIYGSALQVVFPSDVVFTPVVQGPLQFASADVDLRNFEASDLTQVGSASQVVDGGEAQAYFRYYIDNGSQTRIVVWSTGNLREKTSYDVKFYKEGSLASATGTISFDAEKLSLIDPSEITSRPSGFTDGFIKMDLTQMSAGTNHSVFSYSAIYAPAFGAIQTVLNPIYQNFSM